jgi:anaerobic ribonucleoside-triphosphate reductase activating protein
MNYHNITYPDMLNGDGLRVVLWLSGCSHHCKCCQNPQTWDAKSGIPFDEKAKEELFRELEKDYISGITLSGGDPLHNNNVREVYQLLQKIKNKYPEKTIWIYTGYTIEEIMHINKSFFDWTNLTQTDDYRKAIIEDFCDVLVDGRYIEEKKDTALKWRGSSNQRVLNVLESLRQNKVVLYCD